MRSQIIFIFFVLLIFNIEISSAQNCRINYEQNTREQLRNNKVKEIKIHQVESTDKSKPTDHYFIGKDGCATKHVRYDFYSGETESTWSEFIVSKDGLVKTYTFGGILNDSFQLYEKETTHYARSGKILKSIREEFNDLYTITTNQFDTSNYNSINKTVIKIHLPNDTLEFGTHVKNDHKELRTVKEKKEGKWLEREKEISLFENGKLIEYTLSRYGKVVHRYTPDDEHERRNPMGHIEKEHENPLLYNDPKIDTVYTNDLVNFKPAEKSSAKYKALIHFETPHSDKVSHVDIFFTKSELIHKRLFNQNEAMNEHYEYVIYPR